jgi:uncharacterized iron-regulated protein
MRPNLAGVVGLVVLSVASAGCKHAHEQRQENHPLAPGTAREPSRTPPVAWTTTLDRDHPLVGRIWSVRGARFIEEAYMLSALRERGGYVLLGEKHDNADHHALQARVLDAMLSGGRKPVVAFEMFDVDDQRAIDTSRREHPGDTASLARAVSWEKSGWPPWEQYAPIAQLALRADLPIVATGLPRSRMRALMKPAEAREAGAEPPIDEGVPLTAEQEASLRDELRESHCGHLPDARIGGMIRFQRARDASMANALIAAADAAHTNDAVLIAGTGHTRTDRGAGADLAARDPKRAVVSIAFAEVEKGRNDPPAYAVRWNTNALPFDFVWFTPRATDEDPCAAFAH